jgi:dynein heavy chain
MEDDGFYSLEKPGEFITIIKTQFLAAMVTPGGGRNDIPDRLKRYFAVFNCLMPDSASIERIYATIFEGQFISERNFSAAIIETSTKIVSATRDDWMNIKIRCFQLQLNSIRHFT